jgi:hypothetical protein
LLTLDLRSFHAGRSSAKSAAVLDLENLPPTVVRLAAASMVHAVTVQELMRESAETCAAFAAEAGLTFDQYLDAVNWLAEFYETHPPSGLRAN